MRTADIKLMEQITAREALRRHEVSVAAERKAESERKAQKDVQDRIPKGVIIEDNGIGADVLEHLVNAEKLSRVNGRHADEGRILKLIKELISINVPQTANLNK
jgi:predicted metal-dependent RNase